METLQQLSDGLIKNIDKVLMLLTGIVYYLKSKRNGKEK